ncbi:sulfurtransferase TusA family protein [Brevibacillus borstelensis]|uniref:sulfurtransferase TusA family protein n=1 Tax=Brevibacillus borstelensis TaxID=45462 RepID=UPI00046A0FB7|nr:sulfurtransferase TusA family protein [Brevibacillus borstelensis]MCC0567114.1 sulfurtransferase TusA family protein [Brevibacillus borstelensis]MCM3473438.1 sulfurtransferase TusA family protein [Brevibacillus borstelensis]MCM3561474.1 sulfurtransferase TusA family protein [Brevibacillus borstelensis]MCM3593611.1 sulfurtransferase TusA family protein [Brevibacillus borstelensis]MED1850052.1 sulfurtransferase TusA family protein [Brevibacillus borstelensis]
MSSQATIKADKTLDCKGLACPMPIVKTKKAMEELQPGQVIEVQATDKGSLADMQGWAKNTGHQYLGTIEEGEVLKHYLRKSSPNEVKEESTFPYTISHEELQAKIDANEQLTILDVREPAEYAFNRIPGAKSIPLGELEERLKELNPNDEIHVVCRTGSRSGMACQLLAEKGFSKVKNVLPGMSGWTGKTENNQ